MILTPDSGLAVGRASDPPSNPYATKSRDGGPLYSRSPTPTRPLHVAFALGGTDLGRSGIGTYVREVLPPLIARLGQDGGRLTAFGHPSELAAYRESLAGAATKSSPAAAAYPGLNAFWHLAESSRFARGLKADVLLLPAGNRRVSASTALPTVAVVHDLAQLRVQAKYDRLRMFYFHHVLLRALRTPTRLVAVSRATRDDLVNAVGVPLDRVDVVYNGVNTGAFSRLDPQSEGVLRARRECALDQRPYLLYPARLEHPGKNHVRLLHAFARSGLAESHTLALSGGDWGASALIEKTIRELRLEKSVAMLGFLSVAQLHALVAGAEAVLMLGLHEGFGLPALEALSAGRPVCVSNTGALPEVVGEFGVQCDPFAENAIAEALQRVLRDPTIRQRCETEGPAWARRFTWESTARGLLDACQMAVA